MVVPEVGYRPLYVWTLGFWKLERRATATLLREVLAQRDGASRYQHGRGESAAAAGDGGGGGGDEVMRFNTGGKLRWSYGRIDTT